MTTSLLLLLLAAGPTGSLTGGRPIVMAPSTVAFIGDGDVKSTFDAQAAGTVVFARWVTLTPGVGAGTFTANLEVNASTVCTISVACSAAAGTEVAQSCENSFVTGDDVDWVADGSGCGTAPIGNVTYVVRND